MAGKSNDSKLIGLAKGLVVEKKVKKGAIANLIQHIHMGADDPSKNLAKCFVQFNESNTNQPVINPGTNVQPGPSPSKDATPVGKHIFISYCHKEQEMVLRIYRSLKEKGYKLWIDTEDIGGNLLDGMARAVTDAWVVLLCISSNYQASQNCRQEAEHTFAVKKEYMIIKLQKTFEPSGWLATLLGAKIYYDFSGAKPYDETLKRLTTELDAVKRRVGVATIKNIPKAVNKK